MAEVWQWVDQEAYDAWLEDLFRCSPDSWDDDASAESVLTGYVHAIEDRLKKLGGCLNKWCRWEDEEPCDHGYLSVDDAMKAWEQRFERADEVAAQRALFLRAVAAAEELPADLVVGSMCHCDDRRDPSECDDHWTLYFDTNGFDDLTGHLASGRTLNGYHLRHLVAAVRALHGEPDQKPALP